MKIAAVSGADTHGPRSVARARAKLGVASKLLSLVMPRPPSARPELDATTLVRADGRSPEAVIAAVKARRTVAVYALPDLDVDCPGLGEVQASGHVELRLTLSRPVGEVTLYREGAAVQTWKSVREAKWQETIGRPAAYVFSVRDGAGRLTTSAIWYEPN
jgi:hypothetical protein